MAQYSHFYLSESPQVSTDAIAGGITAAVVVILLCIGGVVFVIVYIQRRKKDSRKSSGRVEVARYACLWEFLVTLMITLKISECTLGTPRYELTEPCYRIFCMVNTEGNLCNNLCCYSFSIENNVVDEPRDFFWQMLFPKNPGCCFKAAIAYRSWRLFLSCFTALHLLLGSICCVTCGILVVHMNS